MHEIGYDVRKIHSTSLIVLYQIYCIIYLLKYFLFYSLKYFYKRNLSHLNIIFVTLNIKGNLVILIFFLLNFFLFYHIIQIIHKFYPQIHSLSSPNPLKNTNFNIKSTQNLFTLTLFQINLHK